MYAVYTDMVDVDGKDIDQLRKMQKSRDAVVYKHMFVNNNTPNFPQDKDTFDQHRTFYTKVSRKFPQLALVFTHPTHTEVFVNGQSIMYKNPREALMSFTKCQSDKTSFVIMKSGITA